MTSPRPVHTLTINSLTSTGEGIGSLEGLKVFVDGALPGEEVQAVLTTKKKNYGVGKLLKVLSPSSDRVAPICPLFGACGGCQIMHLTYPAQLVNKTERVKEALSRIGKVDAPVAPCIPSPLPLAYRNKIQLPVVWSGEVKTMGLFRKKTHDVIPVHRCFIQSPEGEAILQWIQKNLNTSSVRYVLIRTASRGEEHGSMVIFVTDGRFESALKSCAHALCKSIPSVKSVYVNPHRGSTNTILGPTFRLLAGDPFIIEALKVSGHTEMVKNFRISPSSFFQVNPSQTEQMYQYVLSQADLKADETLLDAFCGVGTMALFGADYVQHVIGIECVKEAIVNATENAKLNQTTNATFICGKAEDIIPKLERMTTVFLNPPRKGCDPRLIQSLLLKEPPKILYISCDPATLARDLKSLCEKYEVAAVQPFDMFPQTMHVETVVTLKIKK